MYWPCVSFPSPPAVALRPLLPSSLCLTAQLGSRRLPFRLISRHPPRNAGRRAPRICAARAAAGDLLPRQQQGASLHGSRKGTFRARTRQREARKGSAHQGDARRRAPSKKTGSEEGVDLRSKNARAQGLPVARVRVGVRRSRRGDGASARALRACACARASLVCARAHEPARVVFACACAGNQPHACVRAGKCACACMRACVRACVCVFVCARAYMYAHVLALFICAYVHMCSCV